METQERVTLAYLDQIEDVLKNKVRKWTRIKRQKYVWDKK